MTIDWLLTTRPFKDKSYDYQLYGVHEELFIRYWHWWIAGEFSQVVHTISHAKYGCNVLGFVLYVVITAMPAICQEQCCQQIILSASWYDSVWFLNIAQIYHILWTRFVYSSCMRTFVHILKIFYIYRSSFCCLLRLESLFARTE